MCVSGVYAILSCQVHVHAYMLVHGVMFVPLRVCICVFLWLFACARACWQRCFPNVYLCIHARVCPGAMGANLHTVITRCQTPPHWLWHVNYMACFHLLWWQNTHIKRCAVLICEFVCACIICTCAWHNCVHARISVFYIIIIIVLLYFILVFFFCFGVSVFLVKF